MEVSSWYSRGMARLAADPSWHAEKNPASLLPVVVVSVSVSPSRQIRSRHPLGCRRRERPVFGLRLDDTGRAGKDGR